MDNRYFQREEEKNNQANEQMDLIETLPVGNISIYIHNYQIPNDHILYMHSVRVQYGRIDPKTGLFV